VRFGGAEARRPRGAERTLNRERAQSPDRDGASRREESMKRTISITLNGKPETLTVDDERMLLWVLRCDLHLTGVKFGCGAGLCGACTVLVDDQAARACDTRVKDVAGKKVLTIEGLEKEGKLHPLQQAFIDERAFQCGFCTPGMILNAYAILLKTPRPTSAEIARQMEDNLCRCGSHVRIVRAVQTAAEAMRGGVR
jgi:nicotinate dehydrogenase subunit A